uniref:uncharacterized protein LOC123460247 n=1 Tax=Jaculus jaculus TaxID=51337 RepID=UPI001E1B1A11|nr:uncharacterized protein LOC123460247 [Jaculus jaculus]
METYQSLSPPATLHSGESKTISELSMVAHVFNPSIQEAEVSPLNPTLGEVKGASLLRLGRRPTSLGNSALASNLGSSPEHRTLHPVQPGANSKLRKAVTLRAPDTHAVPLLASGAPHIHECARRGFGTTVSNLQSFSPRIRLLSAPIVLSEDPQVPRTMTLALEKHVAPKIGFAQRAESVMDEPLKQQSGKHRHPSISVALGFQGGDSDEH